MTTEKPSDLARADNGPVLKFDTYGTFRAKKGGHFVIRRILAGGGSVINLMPEDITHQMNLEEKPSSEFLVKTADGGTATRGH